MTRSPSDLAGEAVTTLAPNDLDERGTIRRMNDVNYAIDAWLGDLARAGRTPATRLKYQQVLWALATFLERDGIRDCDRITPDHCRRFLDRWVNASPSTMALGVTVLRGFFAFLVEETVLDHSPAERIKRPRRKRPEELRDYMDGDPIDHGYRPSASLIRNGWLREVVRGAWEITPKGREAFGAIVNGKAGLRP